MDLNVSLNPFQAASKSKKIVSLTGIYVAVLGLLLTSTGFSTLLPAAATDIGGMDIYPLANAIGGPIGISLMPLFGYLCTRNPAIKRPLFSVSMLVGASVVFLRGIAGSMWAIIIPSALWGFVSASIFVIGYSMIRDMYDAKMAGMYLGFVGTMMSVGMLIGPALTGMLIDQVSWRAVCYVIFPVLVLAGILVFFGVRATTEEAKPMAVSTGKFDFAGAISLVFFLAGLVLFLSLGTSFVPFGTPLSWVLLTVTVVGLLALILVVRKKGGTAFIPAPVLKDHNVFWFSLCNFMLLFSSMAVTFFMPAYVLYVMQGSATEASLTVALMAVAGLFLGPVFGRLIAKSGNARGVTVFGTVVRIAVTALLYILLKPDLSIWILYALILFAGIYNSQQSVTFSAGPQIQIKPELRVLGNSVISVSQNLAQVISVALYTVVIGAAGIADGMKLSLILALITAVLGLLACLMFRKLPAPNESPDEHGTPANNEE
jgi:MFS family permease